MLSKPHYPATLEDDGPAFGYELHDGRAFRGIVNGILGGLLLWTFIAGFGCALMFGGLWIGHSASVEASKVAQENFVAKPRAIVMAVR